MKVSSSKGKSGSKKQGQKHQNSFAFHPDKFSTRSQAIALLPVSGLCRRCTDIILWRKQMQQYKPLSVPKKCTSCQMKTVKDAYHVLCGACASDQKCCAKCREDNEIVPRSLLVYFSSSAKSPLEILKEKQLQESQLAQMNERQRRSYLRKMNNGDTNGAAKILTCLSENMSDDDFSDFNESE